MERKPRSRTTARPAEQPRPVDRIASASHSRAIGILFAVGLCALLTAACGELPATDSASSKHASKPSATSAPTATPTATPTPTPMATPKAAPKPEAAVAPKPEAAVAAEPEAADAAQVTAKKYVNCAALNLDYPHGVGRAGSVDKTSEKPVTTFVVNDVVYNANTARDRDKDGIACEMK